jgi:hypothetical protein
MKVVFVSRPIDVTASLTCIFSFKRFFPKPFSKSYGMVQRAQKGHHLVFTFVALPPESSKGIVLMMNNNNTCLILAQLFPILFGVSYIRLGVTLSSAILLRLPWAMIAHTNDNVTNPDNFG